LGRAYDAEISSSGINITQLGVLRCLARRGGEPLVRIAEEMEMDRTSLYRALTPMIRDGWIAPSEEPRFRTARVTKEGRRLLAQANKHWDKVQKRIIGRFGKNAYRELVSELHRLADCAGLPHRPTRTKAPQQ
jgi:DNA-binding MarR family transcriptional regulator